MYCTKNNRRISLICILAVFVLIFSSCSDEQQQTADAWESYDKVLMSASWEYNYASVDEMTESSDLIANVTVKSMQPYKPAAPVGIDMTVYKAQIDELIYGEEQSEIEIVMTGGISESEKKIYEIEDDPLMKVGDSFLIFAQKNESGTYTVLSGSQGRFEVENDKVYSLNVSNEQVKKHNQDSNIKVDGKNKSKFYNQINKKIKKIKKR